MPITPRRKSLVPFRSRLLPRSGATYPDPGTLPRPNAHSATCHPLPVAHDPPALRREEPRAPLVTVAIPAYNRPGLLREALASLEAQVGFDDFEVVICDDLGLAATRAVVEASRLPRLRYFVNPQRLGGVGNWNRCLQLATGRWVTVLHEDDSLYPWFFATTVPRLGPELSAVAMRCEQGATRPAVARRRPAQAVRRYDAAYFLKSGLTPFPGVLFPRRLALLIGGFDERQGPLADYDFWYRLGCTGRIELIDDFGAFYRVSDGQWTARAWPEMLRKMHLLRLRIAREQLPRYPRLGRWLARFFTYRNALSYGRRFSERPVVFRRVCCFSTIPFQVAPSGWVWLLLRHLPHLVHRLPA